MKYPLALLSAAAMALGAAGARLPAGQSDVTWRIPFSVWMGDESFEQLTRLFATNGITGKLALFTSELHCPAKLAEVERCAAKLKTRIAALHKLGYVAGINHLVTLGHFDECVLAAEDVPSAARFTNRHGEHGKVQYCPMDGHWRSEYLEPCYRALAATGADFIWTDDDIRLRHHAVKGGGCFCDACMERVRRDTGYVGGREGLEAWLSAPGEALARRRAFLQHNRDTLFDFYSFLERTIHSVDPAIDIGVMDSADFACWHGLPFEEIFAALKTPASDVYWRPGGGFYKDSYPDAVVQKANALAAESARIPADVSRIEGELEAFLYQRVDKSMHFTALEGMLYVALGLHGVAYNVFSPTDNEGLDAYAPLVRRLEANRPAYAWIFAAAGRSPCRGVWAGDGERDTYAGAGGDGWLDVSHIGFKFRNSELQYTGIPIAYRFEDAQVFAPSPEVVRSMSAEKLERMLSGGTYLDIASLEALVARGYGADVGFAVGENVPSDVRERFTDHPLNAGVAGFGRNARPRFFHQPQSRNLVPMPGAEALSVYLGEGGEPIPGSCAMGVFVNRRGGRVCVNAYVPWLNTSFRRKRTQLRSVFRWLSGDTISGMTLDDSRVALWVRGDKAAVALNMSHDAARDVVLDIAGEFPGAQAIIPPSVSEATLRGSAKNGRTLFRIPEIPPWSMAVLRFSK